MAAKRFLNTGHDKDASGGAHLLQLALQLMARQVDGGVQAALGILNADDAVALGVYRDVNLQGGALTYKLSAY